MYKFERKKEKKSCGAGVKKVNFGAKELKFCMLSFPKFDGNCVLYKNNAQISQFFTKIT